MAWWVYFSVSFYYLQQPPPGSSKPLYVTVGSYLILKTFLLIFLYVLASNTFIYRLLPQLIKGKWLQVGFNTILLGAILFWTAYLLYWNIFPIVDSLFGPYKPARFPTRFWPAVSLGLIDPLKVITAAAIIKYVKYWWLKKQESEKLERERINAELQLLKAQIQPQFLFTALNKIYVYSLAGSPLAPEMLLKLSDLLSYMLYECNELLVPLEKEVEMMKDYIALERLDDAVEVELSVKGNMKGKTIAPFLLLPFIENSLKQSSSLTEQAWMNMDISINGDAFTMKLASGIKPDNDLPTLPEKASTDVQKRLTLIYPQKHELKISQEPEMLLVSLKINLAENTVIQSVANEKRLISEQPECQPNLYAAQE
jgi:hypothetical protein